MEFYSFISTIVIFVYFFNDNLKKDKKDNISIAKYKVDLII